LLGSNGAGKSTLLACLAGLNPAVSCAIDCDGENLAQIAPARRARCIGYLPQQAEIHWDVDVQTLVALGRLPWRGVATPREDALAVAAALQSTDIDRWARRPVRQLSGGEQARVLLARVLAGEPRWLLADEPLANLDPAHQLDIAARLRDNAARGMGVVIVIHDLALAARLADNVLLLKGGQVLAAGPRVSVLTSELLAETFDVEFSRAVDAQGETLWIPKQRRA
jgi:iron complex transport system ATP-binding protein